MELKRVLEGHGESPQSIYTQHSKGNTLSFIRLITRMEL